MILHLLLPAFAAAYDDNNFLDGKHITWLIPLTFLTAKYPKTMKLSLGHQTQLQITSQDFVKDHHSVRKTTTFEPASAQSNQSLHCSHTWSMEVDEESDQKSDI